MTYKDPKTGEILDEIFDVTKKFCANMLCKEKSYVRLAKNCASCRISMYNNGYLMPCERFRKEHPAEAARLMGYEVIEDSTTEIDDTPTTLDDTPTGELVKEKPRLAEVLGVDEDEIFEIENDDAVSVFRIHNGVFQYKPNRPDTMWDWSDSADSRLISAIINHPESIIRAPRLTEAELERCRVYGAKWVSKDPCSTITVELWEEKPRLDSGVYISNTKEYLVRAKDRFFPSVRPGDLINVEEAQT